MAAEFEFEFRARLISAFEAFVADGGTGFEPPIGGERTESGAVDIFVPSVKRDGVAIAVEKADVDPHDVDVIRRAHQYARDRTVSLFATANPNDVFLFRRAESATSTAELERRHYDLRDLTLEAFVETFLEDVAAVLRGEAETFAFDDVVVSRLRSFHTSVYPLYEELVAERFDADEGFRRLLVEWARENDYAHERPGVEATFRVAAQQYAYLLMNRIVFYELVREHGVETESGVDLDPIYDGVTVDELHSHLRNRFDDVVEKIDYGAIFRDDSSFFAAVPDSRRTKRRLRAFAKSVEAEPLRDVDVDVAGQLYQKLIPAEERRRLGQFYTPAEIGTVLSRWAIDSPDDRFLDPCSGSGAITVEAYKQFERVGAASHREIVRRITAVDVNKFPLHLTALNLATRDVHQPTSELSVYHGSFFDIDPDTGRHDGDRLGVRDEAASAESDEPAAIGTFDATAANPPYVRQKHLSPDRDAYREHLKRFGPSAKRPYYDGEKEIDGRSDLYCYFLTHATEFLDEGAKLAWVVPTKWMTADYGPSLRQFLYDHYKVEAVVGFRKRVFEDALVDTVLLLMERCDDVEERRRTDTNFVRINEKMGAGDVIDLVDRDYGIPAASYMKIRARPDYRTVSVRQSHLMENVGDKLHHYVDAPPLYTAVLEHADTIELGDVADVSRGKKTGANPIFVLDEEAVESRGVEAAFLAPAVKGAKEVDGFEHTASDVEKWMLDVHDYVAEVLSASGDSDGGDLAENVTSSLRADGYAGVLAHIQWAEAQDSRHNSSVEAYDPWFDMGDLSPKTAPVVCPQAMDTRRYFFRSDGNVVASNRFLLVRPSVDADLLLGLLNSSLTKIVVESHGRVTGGGAVNLSASDLRTLRVVDPDALTDDQAATVREGFDRLAGGDESGRDAIDRVLVDVLCLDHDAGELRRIAEASKVARRQKGREVEPLVDGLDELGSDVEMSFRDESAE